MKTAIATKLNILESAIVRIEEWAHVLFVVIKGIGARFVSKKVVEEKMKKSELAEKIAIEISGKYGFGQCSVWAKNGLRVYVKKFGYIAINDEGITLDRITCYKKEIAGLLENFLKVVPDLSEDLSANTQKFRDGMVARYGLSEVLDAEQDVARENWDI